MKYFEKYLLQDVRGRLSVAENPEDERGERSAVGVHQDLQRLIRLFAAGTCEGGCFGRVIDARFWGPPDRAVCGYRGRKIITPDGRIANRGGVFHMRSVSAYIDTINLCGAHCVW